MTTRLLALPLHSPPKPSLTTTATPTATSRLPPSAAHHPNRFSAEPLARCFRSTTSPSAAIAHEAAGRTTTESSQTSRQSLHHRYPWCLTMGMSTWSLRRHRKKLRLYVIHLPLCIATLSLISLPWRLKVVRGGVGGRRSILLGQHGACAVSARPERRHAHRRLTNGLARRVRVHNSRLMVLPTSRLHTHLPPARLACRPLGLTGGASAHADPVRVRHYGHERVCATLAGRRYAVFRRRRQWFGDRRVSALGDEFDNGRRRAGGYADGIRGARMDILSPYDDRYALHLLSFFP